MHRGVFRLIFLREIEFLRNSDFIRDINNCHSDLDPRIHLMQHSNNAIIRYVNGRLWLPSMPSKSKK